MILPNIKPNFIVEKTSKCDYLKKETNLKQYIFGLQKLYPKYVSFDPKN